MATQRINCPECGPSPTPHLLSWGTGLLDWIFTPSFRLMQKCVAWLAPVARQLPGDRLAYYAMRLFSKLGIGSMVKELRPDHSLRTRALWEEAERRKIELHEYRFFSERTSELFVARHGKKLFAFDGLPRPRGRASTGLSWMDDKAVVKQRFQAAGIPVPKGGTAVLVKRALELFDEIGGTVIVKPRTGSRSRHTATNISTRSELVAAFYSAQKLCPWVVVEEHLPGSVFRATVIGGKLVGVARRDVPQVTGDGRQTIAELVAAENTHPHRQAGGVYTVLPGEAEATSELARQGLTWQSVPQPGQVVTLDWKVNRGAGGVTVDVTDVTHADNVVLFEKIAQVVGDPIIGIDFMIDAMHEPWHQRVPCGVIECNSLPFIDLHHYPVSGTPRNAAGAIWDLVWPQVSEGARVTPAQQQAAEII